MKIEAHLINNTKIAAVTSNELIIKSVEDILDLMGDLYYQDFDKIILNKKHITPEFFDLKSGLAGEILQKFSNYRVSLAIVGDFTGYTSKSIKDFMFESNKMGHVSFVSSDAEALNILARR